MKTIEIRTGLPSEMIDITRLVQECVNDSGVRGGIVRVFVPHTTAAVTINENADPDVLHDILADLDRVLPRIEPYYRHGEGNSAAHLKASLFGCSETLFVEDGRLVLGTWQGIYFCEFDGPRRRRFFVRVSEG